MSHIGLSLIPDHEGARAFLVARGKAIQKYAEYEQSLGCLYAILMGVSDDIAGVTFFKISNARTRIAILERLLRKKCGATYNKFWNSLVKCVGTLDAKRNELVHWATIVEIHLENGRQIDELVLKPPNIWDHNSDTPKIVLDDILDFIVKTDFFGRLLNVFGLVIAGHPLSGELVALQEKFLEEVTYPPPHNHPLVLKRQEL